MLYPVKWAYRRLAVFTGSIENGTPTPFMMIVTLITVFISAFMTDILGMPHSGLLVPFIDPVNRRSSHLRWIHRWTDYSP
jgi:hypothetical protein